MSVDGEAKKRIHFGSLEEVEKKRIRIQQQNGGEEMGLSSSVMAGIKAGNINIAEGEHFLRVFRIYLKLRFSACVWGTLVLYYKCVACK